MKPLPARYTPFISTCCVIIIAVWVWIWLAWIGGTFESRDYTTFVRPWVKYISSNGLLGAFGTGFSNYMPLYLYLLIPVAAIGGEPLLGVKILSVIFSILMSIMAGVTVYRCDRHGRGSYMIMLVAAVVMMLPTVTLNATVWAQCDAVYCFFTVSALYLLTQKRGWPAMAMMGLALATKLQAIFIAPVIYYLLIKKEIKWRTLLIVPVVVFLSLVPPLLEGRQLTDLLMIYLRQGVEGYAMVSNFPNIYLFFPVDMATTVKAKAVLTTAIAIATIVGVPLLARISGKRVTRRQIVWLAYICALLYPFILPGMHDRFLMPAEVIGIIWAFLFPKKWWIGALSVVIAVPSYCNFLFDARIDLAWIIPLYAAVIILAVRGYIKRYCTR